VEYEESATILDLPSGIARLQCTRVPRRLLVSSAEGLSPQIQGSSLCKNLSHFNGGTSTEHLDRSHRKPMYVKEELKGRVLDGSWTASKASLDCQLWILEN
jgi:hypothetical protein